MGIGASIFLIALGAILTWAVDWSVGGFDINVVGAILMVAGVGGLILFFYFWNRQRVPEAVTAIRQRQPATVTTVTPQLPPAHVTTVFASAPVAVASQSPMHGD